MSTGFVHSIPVPRLYKTAAKTVRQVTEEGASLKQLIYEKKHPVSARVRLDLNRNIWYCPYSTKLTTWTIHRSHHLLSLIRIKEIIFQYFTPQNLKGVYALATTTLHNAGKLNQIIRHTQLLFKEPRFDPWLARVLITELIWGKGVLNNDSKPIKTILTYENIIREYLQNSTSVFTTEEPKQKGNYTSVFNPNVLFLQRT